MPGFCDDTQRRSEILLISKLVYSRKDEWSYGGIKLTRKTNVFVDKPGVVPLRPPQIQYGLIRDRNLTSAVRGRELTARARTSKSDGQDFCFLFGGTEFKYNIPKEEEKANMLTEMLGDCREQVNWCRFAYIALTVFLYFITIKWPQIWVYLTLTQSSKNAQIMGPLEHPKFYDRRLLAYMVTSYVTYQRLFTK